MEVFQDIDPVSGYAAFGGYQLVQTAREPAVPTVDVLPEPRKGGSLLIKPACAFRRAVQARCRGAELAVRVNLVAEEIKAFFRSADEPLHRVQGEFEVGKHPVDCPDGAFDLMSTSTGDAVYSWLVRLSSGFLAASAFFSGCTMRYPFSIDGALPLPSTALQIWLVCQMSMYRSRYCSSDSFNGEQ